MGTAVLLVAWAQKQGQENASHPHRLMGAQLVLGKTRKQRVVKTWHVLVCYICIPAYISKINITAMDEITNIFYFYKIFLFKHPR